MASGAFLEASDADSVTSVVFRFAFFLYFLRFNLMVQY